MRISTKVEYGLIAILDIAIHSAGSESISSLKISEHNNIPRKFLEQIMISLRSARLVTSVKGSKGGYRLVKSPEQIKLTEVINALDISLLEHQAIEEINGSIRSFLNENIWEKLNDSILNITDNVTLQDLIDKYSESGDNNMMMFYI